MTDTFGTTWAARKLDMPRRRAELKRYIDCYLPELKEQPPGLVLDVGCGPGDFLALCREVGHDILGIEAPDGGGGMGDAYWKLAKQHRERMGIPCLEYGLSNFLACGDLSQVEDRCVLVHSRGSIEQALSCCMTGPPHDEHHDCRQLDWITDDPLPHRCAPFHLELFFRIMSIALRPGGVLLISANGTKTTNRWYDETVQREAESMGLRLRVRDGELLHKWEKP